MRFAILCLLLPLCAHAGAQKEEDLSVSVRAVLQKSISDTASPKLVFASEQEGYAWLAEMSRRLEKRIPDKDFRLDFLKTVHYEATRAPTEDTAYFLKPLST